MSAPFSRTDPADQSPDPAADETAEGRAIQVIMQRCECDVETARSELYRQAELMSLTADRLARGVVDDPAREPQAPSRDRRRTHS